jgi:hypothetical protein
MTSPSTFLTVDAIKAWRPDAVCIAAGDEHAYLALRCYAAAGLSDAAIAQHLRRLDADLQPLNIGRHDAALALARHGALVGAPARQVVAWLVFLACEVPCWPDDPYEIAAMARAAMVEMAP